MRVAVASAPQSSASERQSPDIVESVASLTNLAGLGIKVSEYLTDWEDNENRSVICFDSLIMLLQYTEDVQTTFNPHARRARPGNTGAGLLQDYILPPTTIES